MILLVRRIMKRKSENAELAFSRYVESVPPLDRVDEALRTARLQQTTARFAKEGHDVERKEDDEDAVATGECLRAVSIQRIISELHSALARNAVYLLTTELSWSSQ